jgi:hypothetical protein
MRFNSKNKQDQVVTTMLHYRWPFLVMLYATGMAHAEAICHPPPALANNEISTSELESINRVHWPVPIFAPNELIDDGTFPGFAIEFDVLTPTTDDYTPLSLGEKWSGFKKLENIPSQ